eukprot:EG_transcript_31696
MTRNLETEVGSKVVFFLRKWCWSWGSRFLCSQSAEKFTIQSGTNALLAIKGFLALKFFIDDEPQGANHPTRFYNPGGLKWGQVEHIVLHFFSSSNNCANLK